MIVEPTSKLVTGYYLNRTGKRVDLKQSDYHTLTDWLAEYSGPVKNSWYGITKTFPLEEIYLGDNTDICWISVNADNNFLRVKIDWGQNHLNNGSFRFSAKCLTHKEACYKVIESKGREQAEKIWSARQITRWTEQNNEQVLVRMPYLTKRKVKKLAKKLGINPPTLIRDATEEYLSNLEKNDLNVYENINDEQRKMDAVSWK